MVPEVGRVYCVLRRQNPTFAMDSAIADSSVSKTACTESVPPTAERSLETAASVTSSLVWDESIREIRVAKRRFYSATLAVGDSKHS